MERREGGGKGGRKGGRTDGREGGRECRSSRDIDRHADY